jgi:hypothetical protein
MMAGSRWSMSDLTAAEARARTFESQARLDVDGADDELVLREWLRTLGRRAPGAEVAYVVATIWAIRDLVALSPDGDARELLRVPPAETDALRAILGHWRDRPGDGIGASVGSLGLVVAVERWEQWREWLRAHAVIATQRQTGGYAGVVDPSEPTATDIDMKPLGEHTITMRSPAHVARRGVVTDAELLEMLGRTDLATVTSREVAAALQPSTDLGGWLCWRGATAKPHPIDDGLRVCADDEIVTLVAPADAPVRVDVAPGAGHVNFEAGELPPWLAGKLGVR